MKMAIKKVYALRRDTYDASKADGQCIKLEHYTMTLDLIKETI